MLIVQSVINVTQVPSQKFPGRKGTLQFTFLCEFEATDGWEDLTNTGHIVLPKNVTIKGSDGSNIKLSNRSANIGGFSETVPFFLRGDEISINAGYKYYVQGRQIISTAIMFQGFISRVSSRKPFKLECEDNMWKLKQTPARGGINGVFPYTKYNVEDMLRELIRNAGLPYTVNALTKTNLGIDFRIDNDTIGQILERLRHDHYLFSYFYGDELRCGAEVYIESTAQTKEFIFQENIIDDDLSYMRKDDLVLSALAFSTNRITTAAVTKDGHKKTKTGRLEALIIFQNGSFQSFVRRPGERKEFPPNNNGERHEFHFNNITDPDQLVFEAKQRLKKYYYTGFRGKFTTFGIPFVKQGDNAKLTNKVLPEQDGTYKIKSVNYKCSVDGGLRQEIELDFRLNTDDNE